MMGSTGFDRAKSNRVDSTVGDDRKSSKTIDANVSTFKYFETDVVVANDEQFALAA